MTTNPTQPTVGQGEDMPQDTGVPLSGSGSRPTDRASEAVSPVPASIPNALERHLLAETESHLVMGVAAHVADRIHEIVKTHACTMPSVGAAIGLGAVVCQQIYAETVQFAVNSMDGDSEDEAAVRDASRRLIRDVLDVPDDRTELSDLRAALKPFADALSEWGDESDIPDSATVWEHPIAMCVTLEAFRRTAIATEAGTAGTTQIGPVHEGAGPKDIAHD